MTYLLSERAMGTNLNKIEAVVDCTIDITEIYHSIVENGEVKPIKSKEKTREIIKDIALDFSEIYPTREYCINYDEKLSEFARKTLIEKLNNVKIITVKVNIEKSNDELSEKGEESVAKNVTDIINNAGLKGFTTI